MRKVFKRALRRAGLPGFRVYDLRHTYASLLLAVGAPITYVSAQLGHANPSTTLRYYAKWIPSKGRRWVDLLDRVRGAFGSKTGTKISGTKPPPPRVLLRNWLDLLVGRQGLEPWTR